MLLHRALHTGLAQVIIAQGNQLTQGLVTLSRDGKVRDLEQAIGGLAHRRHHHHWLAVDSRFYDSGDTLERHGGFTRGAAERHYDHRLRPPSLWGSLVTCRGLAIRLSFSP